MPRGRRRLDREIVRQGVSDPRVIEAFEALDRADFVPDEQRSMAYEDRPVQILESQTTSQPSLIARMIEWAEVGPGDVVLEVGTGFGFQTALLGSLAAEVYSIERIETIARQAQSNLEAAGISNAHVVVGDGWKGLPEHAPYDAIIVSAAATEVPRALIQQLVDGGRLVIPVAEGDVDNIYLYERRGAEAHMVRLLTPARFVPLIPGSET